MPDTETDPNDAPSADDMVQRSPLATVFGDHAKTRIIRALSTAKRPANPSSIAEAARIDESTWYAHRDDLLDAGIIREAGKAGNSPLYELTDDERREAIHTLRALTGEELRG